LHCIGQEQAKRTLAVAVHNHYKRIRQDGPSGDRGRRGVGPRV
jgi:ATP-dependent protease Clp ATPase subunit